VYVRPGVQYTRVGYTGGTKKNPTYYSLGDHTESIQILYDPKLVTYSELLDIFFDKHDPTSWRSNQYKSAIWYTTEEQKQLALERKKEVETKLGTKIYTTIEPAAVFTLAEDYHQKYYLRGSPYFQHFRGLPLSKFINSQSASIMNAIVDGDISVDIKLLQEMLEKAPDLPASAQSIVIASGSHPNCIIS